MQRNATRSDAQRTQAPCFAKIFFLLFISRFQRLPGCLASRGSTFMTYWPRESRYHQKWLSGLVRSLATGQVFGAGCRRRMTCGTPNAQLTKFQLA